MYTSRVFWRVSGTLDYFENFNNFWERDKTERGMWLISILQLHPVRKVLLLLLIIFHLCVQMFQQPDLPSEVLSQILWVTGHWQCWAGVLVPGTGHRWTVLVCLLPCWSPFGLSVLGETFNTRWRPWGALKRLSPPHHFSPLLGPILCNLVSMNTFMYISIFSLVVWRKYTLV